jgi:hypothetical protein
MAAKGNHFSALMKKNFILWYRNCCCACLEIMIPALFLCVLFVIRSASKKAEVPELPFNDAAIPIVPNNLGPEYPTLSQVQ